LSKGFSIVLLLSHALILLVFAFTRWVKPADMPVPTLIRRVLFSFPPDLEKRINARLTPTFITTTIFTSMAIGMLCARSLHYQFYAYIAWATPLLLWKAGLHPVPIYAVWAAQEWSWNVFPSTDASSMVVVGTLAIQVLAVWWGTRNEFTPREGQGADKKHAQVE